VKNWVGLPRHPRVRVFFVGEEMTRVEPFEIDLKGQENRLVDRVLPEEEIIKLIPEVFPLSRGGGGEKWMQEKRK